MTNEEVIKFKNKHGFDPLCEHGRVHTRYGIWCHKPMNEDEWNQFSKDSKINRISDYENALHIIRTDQAYQKIAMKLTLEELAELRNSGKLSPMIDDLLEANIVKERLRRRTNT
jgi:hypothetical protein